MKRGRKRLFCNLGRDWLTAAVKKLAQMGKTLSVICNCGIYLYLYDHNILRIFIRVENLPHLRGTSTRIHYSPRPDSRPRFTERPLYILHPAVGFLCISTIYPPYASNFTTPS